MIEIKMGINESIQILKRISTSLLQIRENANLTYKESHEDFVHKADALCLSFMQKIESCENLYYSVLHSDSLMGKIVDINSLYTIYRSILETLIYFYYGFVLSSNNDEETLSILLWKIAGLQNIINTKDNIPQRLVYKINESIDDYKETKNRILSIIEKYNFNQDKQSMDVIQKFRKDSCKITNSPYFIKLTHDGNSFLHKLTITDATNKYFEEKSKYLPNLYTLLSVSAHPSYIGLQRYEEILRSAMSNDLSKINAHLNLIFKGIVIIGSCFYDEYKEFLGRFEDIFSNSDL